MSTLTRRLQRRIRQASKPYPFETLLLEDRTIQRAALVDVLQGAAAILVAIALTILAMCL